MADSMPHKMITRGIPTKILNFDGPSFSLQITQGESDFAGKSATTVSQRRTKLHNDKSKEVQVEKSSKETKNPVVSKMKKPMNDSSCVNVKEVAAKKISDTRHQKVIAIVSICIQRNLYGINFFVKHQPKFAPHISVYTNTDIVSQLKENLTPDQYQQLVHVNGTSLHFILREFAIVTGLKCVGNDEDFEFSEKFPNRLIETYFGGANLVKKEQLMKCFADKNWGPDNDGDALKISLLYFIHTFIFSSEKNSTTIPRLHFDLVESGRYSEYHWGLKAFEMLTKSISMKMDAEKKYYRIAGMPLAMQVWFYECYSVVDSKIALRVDDVVPKILNWRTTRYQPTIAYLMNDMFNDIGNMIVYKDISPSDIELAIIQNPPAGVDLEKRPSPAHSDKSGEDSDDFSPTPELQCKKKHIASVGPSSSPSHKKRKEHERHPNETQYQPKIPPVCVSEFGHKVLHDNQLQDSQVDEVSSLRKDLNSFKEYVIGEFKSLRTLINDNFKKLSDHLQQNQQTESLHQRKEPIGRRDDGIDTDVGDNVEKQVLNDQCLEYIGEGKTTSEVPSNIPSTGQEGISTKFYVSQFELDDKFLPSQIPETKIIIHNNAKKAESTPIPSHRNRRPSRWYSSPYEYNFDSAGTLVKLTPIVEKRHPFEDDSITGPHPTLIIQEYDKWVRDGLLARHDQRSNLEDHYKKNKSTLHIPLDFVVDQVNSKNWFFLLSFDGKLWDDNTRIAEIFDRYADTDSNANVAKEEDVDKLHWVLAVVSFKERCIKVYDSYRSAGHDAYVVSEIDKLAKLVPLYLSISGFYRDSQGIDWSTYSAYTDKSHNDPFEDCGVHVAAYAEFLSTLGEIPQITFDSSLLRQRYGALLWNYAMRKIDADAISENEAPSNIARQITESDSKMQIVLE
ncbi:uncharacterized protein [Nicotiana sylvestris]|uniref:uncharacterized protein n=1 Tax=Nicotiana sylvestris TaxID=4096 RepID=UPI00388CCFAE